MTHAKGARGMFDHLNAAHRYDAEGANSVVTALAKASGWSPVKPFDPSAHDPHAGRCPFGCRDQATPDDPPPDTWEELVHYLIDVMHVIHRDGHIPKYQFERHVDSLLVPFLPEILAWRLGGVFQVVASEFPIKKIENDQSTNADAVLHQRCPAERQDTWWIFEPKTDPQSVRLDQLEPYARACALRMGDLVADLETIGKASKAKHKYQVAGDLLREAGASFDAPVRLVYISPYPVPLLETIPGSIAIVFDELLDLELTNQLTAWGLFRDHLLAPIVGR